MRLSGKMKLTEGNLHFETPPIQGLMDPLKALGALLDYVVDQLGPLLLRRLAVRLKFRGKTKGVLPKISWHPQP